MNKKIKVSRIQKIANYGLLKLHEYGYIPGGQNGPYNDNETPVRNTAHFLIIFSFIYNQTSDKKFLDAAHICFKYLISEDARPMSPIFFMRKKKGKDFSNGLIGQAWTVEALSVAYSLFKDKRALQIGKENFEAHQFNESYKLWHIQNVDGSQSSIDWAFNHQLWFAAVNQKLNYFLKSESIEKVLNKFYSKLDRNMNIHSNGLIKHSIIPTIAPAEAVKKYIKPMYNYLKYLKTGKNSMCKENGYHSFNLYAFSIIRQYKELEFFKTLKFKKTIDYLYSPLFKIELTTNKNWKDSTIKPMEVPFDFNRYSFAYNAPGFEIPFIERTFLLNNKQSPISEYFWNLQNELTYDESLEAYEKNTEDPHTLNARIYELIRSLK